MQCFLTRHAVLLALATTILFAAPVSSAEEKETGSCPLAGALGVKACCVKSKCGGNCSTKGAARDVAGPAFPDENRPNLAQTPFGYFPAGITRIEVEHTAVERGRPTSECQSHCAGPGAVEFALPMPKRVSHFVIEEVSGLRIGRPAMHGVLIDDTHVRQAAAQCSDSSCCDSQCSDSKQCRCSEDGKCGCRSECAKDAECGLRAGFGEEAEHALRRGRHPLPPAPPIAPLMADEPATVILELMEELDDSLLRNPPFVGGPVFQKAPGHFDVEIAVPAEDNHRRVREALVQYIRSLDALYRSEHCEEAEHFETIEAPDPLPAPRQVVDKQAVYILRDTASQLDMAANALEMEDLCEHADQIRQLAQRLRHDARHPVQPGEACATDEATPCGHQCGVDSLQREIDQLREQLQRTREAFDIERAKRR